MLIFKAIKRCWSLAISFLTVYLMQIWNCFIILFILLYYIIEYEQARKRSVYQTLAERYAEK